MVSLPAPYIPDGAGLINAARTGQQDYLAAQKRNLMKEAGGLAAAGNYGGAAKSLLQGGELDEGFKMKKYLSGLDTQRLAIKAQAQDKIARLAGVIKTPEQLEQAKVILKRQGMNVDHITMENLPMIQAQSLSVKDQLAFELKKRQADIMQQRVDAKTAKDGAPKPLTEGQAAAENFRGMLEQAEGNLPNALSFKQGKDKKPVPGLEGETPMGGFSNSVANNPFVPGFAKNLALDKKQKQYLQAAMQFTRAKLRKESGASIAPDEFYQDYLTYFPQPGDDQQTLRQKSAARKQIIAGFRTQATGNRLPTPTAPQVEAPDPADAQLDNDLSKWGDDDILRELGANE